MARTQEELRQLFEQGTPEAPPTTGRSQEQLRQMFEQGTEERAPITTPVGQAAARGVEAVETGVQAGVEAIGGMIPGAPTAPVAAQPTPGARAPGSLTEVASEVGKELLVGLKDVSDLGTDLTKGLVSGIANIPQGFIDLFNLAGTVPGAFIQFTDEKGEFSPRVIFGKKPEDLDVALDVDISAKALGLPQPETIPGKVAEFGAEIVGIPGGVGAVRKGIQIVRSVSAGRKASVSALENLRDVPGLGKQDVGEAVSETLKAFSDTARSTKNAIYNLSARLIGTSRPLGTGFRDTFLQKTTKVIDEFGEDLVPVSVRKRLLEIQTGKKEFTIGAARDLRTLLKNNISKKFGSNQDVALARIVDDLDDAFEQGIRAIGDPRLAEGLGALNIAKQMNRDLMQVFQDPNVVRRLASGQIVDKVVDRIVGTSPEALGNIRVIRKALLEPPPGALVPKGTKLADVPREVGLSLQRGREAFRQIGRASIDSKMQTALKTAVGDADIADPATLVKAARSVRNVLDNTFGDQKLRELLLPDDLKQIQLIRTNMDRIVKAGTPGAIKALARRGGKLLQGISTTTAKGAVSAAAAGAGATAAWQFFKQ